MSHLQNFLRKFADVHSGGYYVSPESLKKVMASLGERLTHEEVEEMMRMADTNQDGLLHYEEFRDFLDKLWNLTRNFEPFSSHRRTQNLCKVSWEIFQKTYRSNFRSALKNNRLFFVQEKYCMQDCSMVLYSFVLYLITERETRSIRESWS